MVGQFFKFSSQNMEVRKAVDLNNFYHVLHTLFHCSTPEDDSENKIDGMWKCR